MILFFELSGRGDCEAKSRKGGGKASTRLTVDSRNHETASKEKSKRGSTEDDGGEKRTSTGKGNAAQENAGRDRQQKTDKQHLGERACLKGK